MCPTKIHAAPMQTLRSVQMASRSTVTHIQEYCRRLHLNALRDSKEDEEKFQKKGSTYTKHRVSQQYNNVLEDETLDIMQNSNCCLLAKCRRCHSSQSFSLVVLEAESELGNSQVSNNIEKSLLTHPHSKVGHPIYGNLTDVHSLSNFRAFRSVFLFRPFLNACGEGENRPSTRENDAPFQAFFFVYDQ